MAHIIKAKPTCDAAVVAGLSRHASATVHEAMGRRGALHPSIKPVARGMRVCGPALTVRCHPGDNLMLIKAISMAKAGDVIIADMGIQDCGPFGEVLAVECATKRLGGVVLSGASRDSREITELGFPVFSAGLCIRGTAKATLGTINHPISCGGQLLHPGDIVLGDDDGVVVIPLEEAAETLRLADGRVAREEAVMARLREGESLFDIYGYQKVLDALHCGEE